MASEPLYRIYGNTAEPYIEFQGRRLLPVVSLQRPKPILAEDRRRPTGEKGSGPYFHTYKRPENGVSRAWIGNNAYTDCVNFDSGYQESGTSYTRARQKATMVATGSYYLCMSYTGYHNTYGMRPYCELFSAYGLRIESDNGGHGTYPIVYGTVLEIRDTVPGTIAEHDYEYFVARHKDELREFFATPCVALNRRIQVANISLGDKNIASLPVEAEAPTISYRYNESDCFDWCCLTGALTHHCASLASAAYIDAANNLPEATCNSIANVIDCVGTLGGLFKGRPPKTPKGIKDLWLGYRYAYCTSKADVKEYAEITRRLMSLVNASSITSNGSCSDGKITCTCTIRVNPSACIPNNAAAWLRQYGFRLSALNAWDMVPYSFVMDWFLHIGSILEYFEEMGDAFALPVDNMWYSFRTKYDNQDCYFRVPGKVYYTLPYVSYQETSSRTIGMRILDSIALFT